MPSYSPPAKRTRYATQQAFQPLPGHPALPGTPQGPTPLSTAPCSTPPLLTRFRAGLRYSRVLRRSVAGVHVGVRALRGFTLLPGSQAGRRRGKGSELGTPLPRLDRSPQQPCRRQVGTASDSKLKVRVSLRRKPVLRLWARAPPGAKLACLLPGVGFSGRWPVYVMGPLTVGSELRPTSPHPLAAAEIRRRWHRGKTGQTSKTFPRLSIREMLCMRWTLYASSKCNNTFFLNYSIKR